MVTGLASHGKDEEKDREELAGELKKSRATIDKLKKIVARQQKILDIHKSLPANRDELEVRLECTATLKDELEARQRELEALNEELEAYIEEFNVQNEELLNTQAGLRDSERYLASIFEGIQEGISILDKDMNIVKANHAMEEWYAHMLPLIGKKCYHAYQGGTSPCEDCPSLRAMKEKTKQMSVVPYVNKRGVAGWMELYSFPLLDDRGNVLGVIEHVRDITERKRAEEKISHLASFPSLNPNPIVETDLDGNLSYMNPPTIMFFPDLDERGTCHPVLTGLKAVAGELEAKKKSYLVREVKVGGSYFQETIHKVPDKKVLRLYILDITKRKLAEEELKAAKDQLASELDAMDRLHAISVQYVLNGNLSAVLDEIINAATSITRADMGNIQILDPESGRLKIVAHRGFERPFLDYFENVAEGHAACGTAMMQMDRVVVEDVSRSPVFVGTPDLEVMLAAGARAVQSTPLLSRTGRLLGMFSTHYRTSRRPDERELKLIDLLARQTADIIERTLAEKQLVDSKAQAELYLDLMGHDIRNMNQVSMGYLELALDSPDIDKKDKDLLLKSIGALESSTRLIENVRKLQKSRSGELKHHEIDTCQTFVRVLARYSSMPGVNASFNIDLPHSCPVYADNLLYEVFENIVGNAVKHGGPEPAIDVRFDVVDLDGGKYSRFIVEDNGPGVPDEMKESIFNRMQQGDTRARGSGLGLYLVKSLVDSYGGKVWAENRVAGDHTKGAKLVVMLPVVEK